MPLKLIKTEESPLIPPGLPADARRITDGVYGRPQKCKDYLHVTRRRPGLVLIGDAAYFVDPLFSSGVHLATHSAPCSPGALSIASWKEL